MSEPREGRRYLISSQVTLNRVLKDGVVNILHEDGGTDYLKADDYNWSDLGPVLKNGYYIDANTDLWYHSTHGEWQRRGPYPPTTYRTEFSPEPVFPIRRVKLEDEIR